MELDLSNHRWLLIGLAALLTLALLGWIGYVFTPDGEIILSWTEWQVLKAQRAYRQELTQLQGEADSLAELLNGPPDPVRAQIVTARIQRLTGDGLPALQFQREKLAYAAQMINDWAVGAGAREAAVTALEVAFQSLSHQPEPSPTPEPAFID